MNDDQALTHSNNIFDYSLGALKDYFVSIGEKPFRATQIIKWLHQQNVRDFDSMSNVSKSLREKLAQQFVFELPEVITHQHSLDGTYKWLLELKDGNRIEMVYIPEADRGTLCVSTQVGCALDCSFCFTAQQGFNRNLSVGEMIGQLWQANHTLKELNRAPVSNIVLMGMGEPLLNYTNVVDAVSLMLDDNAYSLSKRRVTLSTSGIVPALERLKSDLDIALAVSLHAPNNALRDELVPINKKYPIEQLLKACKHYLDGKANRERITIEYVMLDGVNDSLKDAKALAKILKGLPSKINLIPFNTFPQTQYKRSSQARINAFRDALIDAGYIVITRRTRGDDISAACGQLAGEVEDKSRRHERASRKNH